MCSILHFDLNLVLTAFSQSPRAAQFALIFITMIWGGTFLAVQYALNFSTPMFSSVAVLQLLQV
jgi:hypothetical protein